MAPTPEAVTPAAVFQFDAFNPNTTRWSRWVKRFETALVIFNSDQEKKRQFLLHYIGAAAYDVLCDKILPRTPEDITYTEIVNTLEEHYNPKPNEILNQAPRSKEEEKRELTLDEAVNIAKAYEAAEKGGIEIRNCAKTNETSVDKIRIQGKHKLTQDKRQSKDNDKQGKSVKCFRCGSSAHLANACTYKETMCHYCKKKGLLKKMCLQKKKQINQISDEKETLRQNTDCKVEDLFQISCLNNKAEPRRKILCSLDVEGELISFEIDTGSPVSIIILADAKKYFSKAKVKESDTIFYSYCNTRLECLDTLTSRRVPFPLWEAVEAELDKQVSEGLLEKTDKSEWASPIVVVQKVEGKVRICGDYKLTLNPALRIDEHPLPTIDELFRNTAGGTKFTKIDLSKAYLQLQIHPDDRHLLTLSTHRGLYQPTRMMFGIACAAAVWQRFMEKLVGDIPGVTVFLDDIKLTAPDDATHLERLEEILRRLENHNMRVNLGKSQFLADRIEYCGYLIDKQGIHKMKQKVEAIQNMKTPTNKDEVRSCLGLLQNKVEFNWDAKCENALQSIKDVMQSDIVLTH
ncbi:uncharacterized protein LOC118755849 [Rhagoletis pomonella]|uniref:uncharacterized protein LOC118755849 n=1 Tax=Rhagoletis pomonella TaxID=28610 RepID=UPI0017814C6E|nr:uncharacterized protein LOC118755849 [Rhagoletis pomonella]